jgi:hypothetical protein|tara:strand:+ start:1729 stop:2211 length:483 start_codon:yes stop_codon:yes gene_type:complete
MAINFGDGSVQNFSAKVIQVKRNLRSSEIQTSSTSMQDVLTIGITPKSSSSRIRCEFTGVAYVQQEPDGLRGRFYDDTDGNRFGTGLSSDDPLLYRFDLQGGHSGNIFAYAGIIWRADEASWGAGTNKNIKFQLSSANGGNVGFISSFLPATFTIAEEIE